MGIHLEADYRLIAPDLWGFGDTDAWAGPGDLTHDAQANLVRALIESICDIPVHIVGHSYGGATAMRLWLPAPNLVRSLVFIEPILTPLLPQAGEETLFAEYCNFAEAFMQRAEEGHLDGEAMRLFVPSDRRIIQNQIKSFLASHRATFSKPLGVALPPGWTPDTLKQAATSIDGDVQQVKLLLAKLHGQLTSQKLRYHVIPTPRMLGKSVG